MTARYRNRLDGREIERPTRDAEIEMWPDTWELLDEQPDVEPVADEPAADGPADDVEPVADEPAPPVKAAPVRRRRGSSR